MRAGLGPTEAAHYRLIVRDPALAGPAFVHSSSEREMYFFNHLCTVFT